MEGDGTTRALSHCFGVFRFNLSQCQTPPLLSRSKAKNSNRLRTLPNIWKCQNMLTPIPRPTIRTDTSDSMPITRISLQTEKARERTDPSLPSVPKFRMEQAGEYLCQTIPAIDTKQPYISQELLRLPLPTVPPFPSSLLHPSLSVLGTRREVSILDFQNVVLMRMGAV